MSERYTRVAIIFHWLIAALIVANVVTVWVVDSLPEGMHRPAIDWHKSTGMTVLGLALMRILWRWTHRPPPLPADYKPIEKKAAHAAHYLLYALIVVLPLSGYLHDSAWKDSAAHPDYWYGLFQWPRLAVLEHMAQPAREMWHDNLFTVHAVAGKLLYALFALHVAGALKHQWIDKHAELQRMGVGRG
jgi:cytochrome b561